MVQMSDYQKAYSELNSNQKRAVDNIDGPLLVIAGPGTGKTQLLAVRVAHILKQTDTPAQNVLCLTFTENGADNMRDRLSRFIGKTAYDVNIGTYHAFGGELIRRYPEVFAKERLDTPVDELGKNQLLRSIIDKLDYSNPLKQTRHHIGDLISTISEVKRSLLSSDDLRAIAAENETFIDRCSHPIQAIMSGIKTMPRKLEDAVRLFEQILEVLEQNMPLQPTSERFGSLASIAVLSLQESLQIATDSGKTNPLTTWKNKWLEKNVANEFIIGGKLPNKRLSALADVFDSYKEELSHRGWYDFDDMILEAVSALENNDDLRYTLQEQYQYILLDEFQDTNAAQFRLVELLCDNPVNEGRPNIMAVGDDDQAIYAFQGAQYSNMVDFYNAFQNVEVVCLTDNYRSTQSILDTAQNISAQISERLTDKFTSVNKHLTSMKNGELSSLPSATVERRSFLSDIAQYSWVAQNVAMLVSSGTPASQIAVLAPKHRYLEPLVPFLANLEVPVRYEKREDILASPIVNQLLQMSRLAIALAEDSEAQAAPLWKEVLSYEFWRIPIKDLWQLSWHVSDIYYSDNKTSWSKALVESGQPQMAAAAELFLEIAARAKSETCEKLIDYLIGNDVITVSQGKTIKSPLREFYMGNKAQKSQPGLFYETLSNLTELRGKLREYQAAREANIGLSDLLDFVQMYKDADQKMQSTSPYNQQSESVQLMTAFKSKGLEFSHVFLVNCQDTVWGEHATNQTNKLTLPQNLAPIRHAGANEDERLRIFFVAMTRARVGLHMCSYDKTYTGKDTIRLKYLDEREQEDGSVLALALPDSKQLVINTESHPPTIKEIELNWQSRHMSALANTDLKSLLQQRLDNYQLSPTHLTKFIDVEYAGPESFFFDAILRFPQAPSISSQFGDIMHELMQWLQTELSSTSVLPSIEAVVAQVKRIISRYKIDNDHIEQETSRAIRSINAFMQQRGHIFNSDDRAEVNFRNEGVFIGEAHMSGKIDRLEINHATKEIVIVDYKTGHSERTWGSSSKMYKYQMQLYGYKLLVENSHTFKDYRVVGARLEFIEPDHDGRVSALDLEYKSDKNEEVIRLIDSVWHAAKELKFPDTSSYDQSATGIRNFVKDIIA